MPLPIFYSIQLPTRRKLYICCVYGIGGAAVTLGFIRMHALHVLNTNTMTFEAVGEMMIEGALGMSLAAIAHNLPAMRVFWKHVSNFRSEAKRTSYRPCDTEPRDKLPLRATYGLNSTMYGNGSFSRPTRPAMSAASLADRSLSALPDGRILPRYPAVDVDFASRPRTPPLVARTV